MQLPIGWVQVTGAPEAAVTEFTDSLLAPYGDRAAILFTAGAREHNKALDPVKGGACAFEAEPSRVFDVVRELLRGRLFSIIAIETLDCVYPPATTCPVYRAWWVGQQITRLRPLVHQARATILPVCIAPRSGGHVFQAAIDLRVTVRQEGQRWVASRNGRATDLTCMLKYGTI